VNITFLDITASLWRRANYRHDVEPFAASSYPLTVGGGIRTCDDIRRLLNRLEQDKSRINTCSSVLISWICSLSRNTFWPQCMWFAMWRRKIVSAEGEPDKWEIFTHGGRKPTGLERS